ncbi:methyltransferase domain-containing protein [Sulfurimonas paralvinellae]|uniref:Methyltransferase domain-containing protein n=1 Tax=Sulfurimonas paralvinellae TaxID=317658 RepID=A0A7M1BA95_9BACT|nr:methyltransferase domain-containing protein [Sulfurimonas paralvinellae]QOP46639.1 methyltransferase domain-containing protein [Sulfurimonas paralvinellae]
MKISTEFSKYAAHYGKYNVIQEQVADKLLEFVKQKPKKILDLGCGSGALFKKIEWKVKHFVGVDFAPGMLELHPKAEHVECIYGNFNDAMLFEHLRTYVFDYVLSASALQWADDLDNVFRNISTLHTPVALAIFTAGTFQTLNDTAGLEPLLRSRKEIKQLQKKYFPDAAFEVVQYRLAFESVREMFRYIKKSGVSGSRKLLSYKETKKLMAEYPLDYLEFEVAFIAH